MTAHPAEPEHSDVQVIPLADRTVILVGTAHVSQASADLVQEVIRREQPDCVCVELDAQRLTVLSQQRRWEDLDLKEVIRRRQMSPLLANLILSSYQQKIGGQLGVLPGTEMLAAVNLAHERQIPLVLCDREIRITLARAWRLTSFVKKSMLIAALLGSLFDRTEISEETLQQLRQRDVLSGLLDELGDTLPSLRQVLVDERDLYMAEQIRQAAGTRIVAVMGAAHVPGVQQILRDQRPVSLDTLTVIPPASALVHWIGWIIPSILLVAMLGIAWQRGLNVAGDNIMYWILATGLPAALGAVVALAHPATIVSAFLGAPLTTLSPVLGVGYLTALVQAYFCPPFVRELRSVADDVRSFKRWWQNRLLRIFLAFLLPSLGAACGLWIGGYRIISQLLAP